MYEMEGALLDPPSRLATAPSSTGTGWPTAGASHPRPVSGFPVPFRVPPGFPPGAVPVSGVKAFLLPGSRAAQGPGESNGEFFRYPHNDGGYPPASGVIHRLSTASFTAYPQVIAPPADCPDLMPESNLAALFPVITGVGP